MEANISTIQRDSLIKQFWDWFSSISERLASDFEDPEILAELDNRVKQLDSRLSWELGPGIRKTNQLVISPNLDSALLPVTRGIINESPILSAWEFHPARLPKKWDFLFFLQGEDKAPVRLDATRWRYVLLQYSDSSREVILLADSLPQLNDDDKWQAAAIVLESELGEELLLEQLENFQLVESLEPELSRKTKPIQSLRSVVGVG